MGLLFRSWHVGLGASLFFQAAWWHWSARMVIEDQRLGPVVLDCSSGVWLTFDDGPGPQTLPIIELLNRAGVPATFFFIGEQVERFPDLEQLRAALLKGGHSVGNHSFTHPNFLKLNLAQSKAEIEKTQELLERSFPGSATRLFRPPFGYRKPETFEVLREAGLEMIGWSANSLDFLNQSAEAISARVDGLLRPGAIVLMHDGREGRELTLDALDRILEVLKARGYRAYNAHE